MERIVIVSGLSGSGKSNLVEFIAEKFNLKCIHTSSLLKALVEKEKQAFSKSNFSKKLHQNFDQPFSKRLSLSKNSSTSLNIEHGTKNVGFWESEEAKKILEKRLEENKFDEMLDKKLLELIEEGNIVMDSWTMGYLSKKGFKIWLKASIESRAERIAKRNNQEVNEVLNAIKLKEEKTREIYKKLYGFALGEELEKFDLVIDTEKIPEEKVREIALRELEEYFNERKSKNRF